MCRQCPGEAARSLRRIAQSFCYDPGGMPRSARIAVLLVALVVGCGGPWDTVAVSDQGDLCFDQDGEFVTVTVRAPECLSSTCTRDVDGSCDVTIEGSAVSLESDIFWEQKNGPAASCSDDCLRATAICPLGHLDPGNYELLHGEDRFLMTVPVIEGCFE
jgi:hypothetical protein